MAALTMMQVMEPFTITSRAGTGADGSGAANLLSPDPKEVFAHTGPGTVEISINLGDIIPFDTVFLGHIRGVDPALATWEIYGGTAVWPVTLIKAAGPLVAEAATSAPRRRHAFYRHSSLVSNSKYVRLVINPGVSTEWTLGVVGIGTSVQPLWGREWGSGRQPEDRSAVTPLKGGGFGIERAARMANWRWTCGDLTDGEIRELWRMAEEVGVSAPVVVVEDPDYTAGLNERIHYGLFDRPEAYSREIPGVSRWSFQVREWV